MRITDRQYFTGKPCIKGHVSTRLKSNQGCMECMRERNRAHVRANPEANRARASRYIKKNREAVLSRKRAYAEANREKEAARAARWRKENHGRKIAEVTARKAHVKRATPSWADLSAIAQVYSEAARLSRETGIPHHVDHRVPLRGQLVSGLHVAGNLQILTQAQNLAKGNSHAD